MYVNGCLRSIERHDEYPDSAGLVPYSCLCERSLNDWVSQTSSPGNRTA